MDQAELRYQCSANHYDVILPSQIFQLWSVFKVIPLLKLLHFWNFSIFSSIGKFMLEKTYRAN